MVLPLGGRVGRRQAFLFYIKMRIPCLNLARPFERCYTFTGYGILWREALAEQDTQIQLVTFQISEELYGVDIMDVKEIVRVQDIRSIPNAPGYVEGLFNLRGEIIPIISFHKRFHLKKAQLGEDEELLSGFIIIDIDGMKLGRHHR